jgi:hypothetical protein
MTRGEKKCGILGRKGLLANKLANVSNKNDLEWANTKNRYQQMEGQKFGHVQRIGIVLFFFANWYSTF